MNDRFLRACRCQPVDRTPIWLMRQAGRYLPEYRALREKNSFLAMCLTPELSAEATLQPIRRFDLDAAILFSDIMIPLLGLGIELKIVESAGPVIANPVRDRKGADALRILDPDSEVPSVLEAIRLIRRELNGKIPLIGFAGAPFTLASYLIEGKSSRDFLITKSLMYGDPNAWHTLMGKLAESIRTYLLAQIRAGVQAVQLFDSWVGVLSPQDYREFVLPHSKKIFESLAPTRVPAIHFGVGTGMLLEWMKEAGGDVIGVDWRVPLDQARNRLGEVALQGNLDPAILLLGSPLLEERAGEILDRVQKSPGHIFNLGHGVLPGTPVDHVKRLIDAVHEYRERRHPENGE